MKKMVLYHQHLNAKGKRTAINDLSLDCFHLLKHKFWNADTILFVCKNRIKILKKR